jgi:hypothetical protein
MMKRSLLRTCLCAGFITLGFISSSYAMKCLKVVEKFSEGCREDCKASFQGESKDLCTQACKAGRDSATKFCTEKP